MFSSISRLFLRWRGQKSIAKLQHGWGHGRIFPLDPPLYVISMHIVVSSFPLLVSCHPVSNRLHLPNFLIDTTRFNICMLFPFLLTLPLGSLLPRLFCSSHAFPALHPPTHLPDLSLCSNLNFLILLLLLLFCYL